MGEMHYKYVCILILVKIGYAKLGIIAANSKH